MSLTSVPGRADNEAVFVSLVASVALAVCPPAGPVPAVADVDAPPADALIACVRDVPINGALFSHWYAAATKGDEGQSSAKELRDQVMLFLVNAKWMEGEARELGIRISDKSVRHTFNQQKHKSFKTEAEFRKFLADSGMTRSDIEYRVRLDMLSARMQRKVAGKGSARTRERRLARFLTRFHDKWMARTSCQDAYKVESCGKTIEVAAPAAQASAAPTQLFSFQDPQITESSGIVASSRRDDVVFTHNDSGDTARFFAVDTHGCTLGVFTAPWVQATDWEDIARGPGSSLWLGDIGDNNAARAEIAVHRFDEPAVGPSTSGAGCPPASEQTLTPTSYRLRFDDGAHDAETLLVDPHTSQVFIVTKSLSGGALYAAPNPLLTDDVNVLHKIADVRTPTFATGGDISPDGKRVAIRSYGEIYIRNIPGGNLAAAFGPGSTVKRLTSPDSGKQGEGLGFTRTGDGLLTSSEGLGAPVFLIPLSCPRRASVSIGLPARGLRQVRATVDGQAAKVKVRGTHAIVSLSGAARASGKAVVRVTGRGRHGRHISVIRRVGICAS